MTRSHTQPHPLRNSSRRLIPIAAACVALLVTFLLARANTWSDDATASGPAIQSGKIQALPTDGQLVVTVPFVADQTTARPTTITVTLESFKGRELAKAEKTITLKPGAQSVRIPIETDLDASSLTGTMLHVVARQDDEVSEARRATFAAIPVLSTRLIMPEKLLAGSVVTPRIIVRDGSTQEAIGGATVTITLAEDTFAGETDQYGTLSLPVSIPGTLDGSQRLTITIDTPLGRDVITRDVEVHREVRILLTTDKPLYQPTQTIHMRLCALDRADLSTYDGGEALLEVEDAKGNKVFKKRLTTSELGVAAADFVLADEVNEGRYTIRATVAGLAQEKTVTVERYVLPKFKVAVTTDDAFYLPGQKLTGSIQSDYFFGKPVANGRVRITASKFDIGFNTFAEFEGHTDANGAMAFEFDLPSAFVGQPLEQGDAFVRLEAEVVDNADHAEIASSKVTIAAHSIDVVAVPESGTLVAGVWNDVYILTSTPSGEPLRTTVQIGDDTLTTDNMGLATYRLRPAPEAAENEMLSLDINVRTKRGEKTSRTITLPVGKRTDAVLLRSNEAMFKVGETIELECITAGKDDSTIFLDVVRNGQTILTQTMTMRDGRARGTIVATPDLAGTIEVHAYRLLPSTDIVRDTRILYVSRADDLTIDIAADQNEYRPGEDAELRITVTDAEGHPVLAALGVSIVDESVFAMQEMQPGLLKVYFTLEKQLLEPRYQVTAWSMDHLIREPLPMAREEAEANRRAAARVLLAAAETFTEPAVDYDTSIAKATDFYVAMRETIQSDLAAINTAVNKHRQANNRFPKRVKDGDDLVAFLLEEKLLDPVHTIDPWGNPYAAVGWDNERFWWMELPALVTAGPDGVRQTADDMAFAPLLRNGLASMSIDQVEGLLLIRDKDFAPKLAAFIEDQSRRRVMRMELAAAADGVGAGGAPPVPTSGAGGGGSAPITRIREYFPETLYWGPLLVTDANGETSIPLSMADSITTWRLSAMAHSSNGLLGSTTSGIRVFQPFFVDIDLPVALTRNDTISIPVAMYNYLEKPQDVRIELEEADWFTLITGSPTIERTLAAGEVSAAYFTIQAKEVGDHKLTVRAFGSQLSDAIRRVVRVEPDGEAVFVTFNDRLSESVSHDITIPAHAIENTGTILVKIYPGLFSQVVEGMDKILRMPNGCFEQTSATTYPNILVMDYMKRSKQITPEIHMQAAAYINQGYQRLLSYEVNGGGFSWFGDAPANKILTAFGLAEFADMSNVHEVDPNVITRTQQWLLRQQQDDGSWAPDAEYLHAESWGRIQKNNLLPTAYIAWQLQVSGYTGRGLERAIDYLRNNMHAADDPYILGMIANAFAMYDADDDATRLVFEKLRDMAHTDDTAAWWTSGISSMTHATGDSADLETTAMIAQAMIRHGAYPGMATKALTYLIRNKDSFGNWHTTQATILALKAFVMSLDASGSRTEGQVQVSLNGKRVDSITITRDDNDVMRLIDLGEQTEVGDNTVSLAFEGTGAMLYQITGRHYRPWTEKPEMPSVGLEVDVAYDRTTLETDDMATCSVTVRNTAPAKAKMVIVDLGVPPGFAVATSDLDAWVEKGLIEKYTIAARQIIIYFEEIASGAEVKFDFQLRAKFPLKAKTPATTAYLYYNPDVKATAEPIMLTVTE